MMLIVTDGRFNKQNVRVQVHQALTRKILPLLVIVDPATNTNPNTSSSSSSSSESKSESSSTDVVPKKVNKISKSIFDINAVTYDAQGRCKVTSYLEDFPFPFYAVIQDLDSLPQLFSDVLRQWFEMN